MKLGERGAATNRVTSAAGIVALGVVAALLTSAACLGPRPTEDNDAGAPPGAGGSTSATGGNVGVAAHGPTAVQASATGNAGVGVNGSGSGASGRGGVFSGAVAQVRLSPGSRSTHPTSGSRGDLYADSTGRLWFCKKGGNTAVWHQIA